MENFRVAYLCVNMSIHCTLTRKTNMDRSPTLNIMGLCSGNGRHGDERNEEMVADLKTRKDNWMQMRGLIGQYVWKGCWSFILLNSSMFSSIGGGYLFFSA